ncbi:MAG: hypothetical protein FD155_3333 [Bacteroidetes bacterium]|nr:MAG: hypothetical protein FD155_3333 [Bacteroidota bacterium]
MFVRKKKNRSGTTSLIVINKSGGVFLTSKIKKKDLFVTK